jgi:HTH-type transcriptional regulator/antitoxin HigA
MSILKYKVIKSKNQYLEYCSKLSVLLLKKSKEKSIKEEIELLSVLIGIWDKEHNSFDDSDPIELLRGLMNEKKLKSKDLAQKLNVSPGLISDIINYKKGISKEMIRALSNFFKVSQDAFNRVYNLKSPYNSKLKNASVMNTEKVLA